mgnify:CR=1 FL=1
MNKISRLLLGIVCALPFALQAQFVDTKWKVTAYAGEPWYAKPEEELIGRFQSFQKGWADGVFFACDLKGLSKTYTRYTREEFLNAKEFRLFKTLNIPLEDETVYVHRISCNGWEASERRVLYPLVTQDNKRAYYLFEGAIYTLEAQTD